MVSIIEMAFLLPEVGNEYLFITCINQVTVVELNIYSPHTPAWRGQGQFYLYTNNFNIAISEFCTQSVISISFMDLETYIIVMYKFDYFVFMFQALTI
jgi:hypothetical protein